MNFLSLFYDSVRKNRSLYSRLGDFISISIVPTIVSLSFLYIYIYIGTKWVESSADEIEDGLATLKRRNCAAAVEP